MNYLGDGVDLKGYTNSYNWTLPSSGAEPCVKDNNCNCVVRLRYNISTEDLGETGNNLEGGIDADSNAAASPVTDDPIVPGPGDQLLQLAIDTTQFGRTFEDRSHVFHIIDRPSTVSPLTRIFNLNVRGKRGNIVQAYPATEYDFTPEILLVRQGDLVHFQWTGCDNNPAGNAGEGTAKTDRSNIVQIETLGSSVPLTDADFDPNGAKKINPLFDTAELRLFFAYVGQDLAACPTQETLLADNGGNENNAKQDVRNCFKLNAAPRYFDGGLVAMNRTGEFNYMSSRNNNFTNRGQKAVIVVETLIPLWGIIVVAVGGVICVAAAGVAGAMFYAKSHPHSGIAQMVSKF
jgi:hypothetical protein